VGVVLGRGTKTSFVRRPVVKVDQRTSDAFRAVRLGSGDASGGPSLTRRGAALLASGLVFIVGGLFLRDGDGMALGIAALAIVAAAYVLSWWNLRDLELRADVPHQVVAEESFMCRLDLYNHRTMGDAFQVMVEQRLPGGGVLRFQAAWVACGGVSHIALKGSVPRRGVFGGSQIQLRSTFPLGLFSAGRRGYLEERTLVMPRPMIPAAFEEQSLAIERETIRAEKSRMPVLGELHGLRDHRPGDPLRFVNWSASSRMGNLIVCEYDRPLTLPRECLLIFHSASEERGLIRPQDFEWALRLLAGCAKRLVEQGVPVVVRSDFHAWQRERCGSRSEVRRLMMRLASVARAQDTSMESLGPLVLALPPGCPVIWVSDQMRSGWERQVRQMSGARPCFCFDPGSLGKAEVQVIRVSQEVGL